MVAVKNGIIKGFYTNTRSATSNIGFKIGISKNEVYKIFHKKQNFIIRNNCRYYINSDYYDIFDTGKTYTYVFYDKYKNYKVSSIKVIDKNDENNILDFHYMSKELIKIYEYEIFELVNAYRSRVSLAPLIFDETASICARNHSIDMARNNYFSHCNLNNEQVNSRLSSLGIRWSKVAENIAFGQIDPIEVVEGWMNSLGHRENILNDFKRLGVGIAINGQGVIYYTQVFFS